MPTGLEGLLKSHTCLYASFDRSLDADVSRGDPMAAWQPPVARLGGGRLIVVGNLGWRSDQWHHVVATWRNANSGRDDGSAEVYVDGVRRGWMSGYGHRVTWDIADMTIGLGQRYSGRIDEVLILDAPVGETQAAALYGLDRPAGDLVGR